jgi:hypothetical protein
MRNPERPSHDIARNMNQYGGTQLRRDRGVGRLFLGVGGVFPGPPAIHFTSKNRPGPIRRELSKVQVDGGSVRRPQCRAPDSYASVF